MVMTEAVAQGAASAAHSRFSLCFGLRLIWLQHRGAVLSIAISALLIDLCALLLGYRVHQYYSQWMTHGCGALDHSASMSCAKFFASISADANKLTFIDVAFRFWPVAIGIFVGAPLLAREYESGSFRFAWTQEIGARKWLLAQVTGVAAVVTIGALCLGLISQWFASPFNAIGLASPWQSGEFDISTAVYLSWSLFALSLGVGLSHLLRRQLSAMAITGVSLVGLLGSTFWKVDYWVRRLLPMQVELRTMKNFSFQTLATQGTFAPTGEGLPRGSLDNVRLACSLEWTSDSRDAQQELTLRYSELRTSGLSLGDWFKSHGVYYFVNFQPGDRYMLFVIATATMLLIASLVILLATVRNLSNYW